MYDSFRLRSASMVCGALASLFTVSAFAQSGSRVGSLECDVSSGQGMLVTSSKALDCVFQPDGGATPEHYVGTIRRLGVDIGMTGGGQLDWAVLSPSGANDPGSLAGDYGGLSGAITPGVGVGANLLVGGSGKNFSLEPFSVEGQTGLGVAAGVADMKLEYVPPATEPLPFKPHPQRHKKHK